MAPAKSGCPEITVKTNCKEDCVQFGDWTGYNSAQSSMTWITGDQMGMFSLESYPSMEFGSHSALVFGTGFSLSEWSKDYRLGHAAAAVRFCDGVSRATGRSRATTFSTSSSPSERSAIFEGSARKGVRYPGHAVSYHRWRVPTAFRSSGRRVLDRDDISVLPVRRIRVPLHG